MERLRRSRPKGRPSTITDNSEPWIKNPSSVAEYWEISEMIRERCEKWGPKPTTSSKD
jgi:hypothetical protein